MLTAPDLTTSSFRWTNSAVRMLGRPEVCLVNCRAPIKTPPPSQEQANRTWGKLLAPPPPPPPLADGGGVGVRWEGDKHHAPAFRERNLPPGWQPASQALGFYWTMHTPSENEQCPSLVVSTVPWLRLRSLLHCNTVVCTDWQRNKDLQQDGDAPILTK